MAVGEDRTDAHSVGRDKDRLTIAEASTLLGVHKNTVRNRIKNGSYRAEMVQTERGPTYLIERESLLTNLTTNTLSSASQEVVSPQALEFVQELLRPFVSELGEVREELGAERARRELAERERDELRHRLQNSEELPPATPGASESRPPLNAYHVTDTLEKDLSPSPLGDFSNSTVILILAIAALGPAAATVLIDSSLYGPLPDFWSYFSLWLFLMPLVLGYWTGRRAALFDIKFRLGRLGGIAGAASGVLILLGMAFLRRLYSQPLWPFEPRVLLTILAVSVGTAMLFGSATYIGQARRRQVAPDTDPVDTDPVYRPSEIQVRRLESWTPRQQAIIGFAGTIISALLTFLGVLVQVLLSNGGGNGG